MDHSQLRKRLTTHKTSSGSLSGISNDLLIEILRIWESYSGSMGDLSKKIGLRKAQLNSMIHKARKVCKSDTRSDFQEIKVEEPCTRMPSVIEMDWKEGKVIRFAKVELLVDFLKKVS